MTLRLICAILVFSLPFTCFAQLRPVAATPSPLQGTSPFAGPLNSSISSSPMSSSGLAPNLFGTPMSFGAAQGQSANQSSYLNPFSTSVNPLGGSGLGYTGQSNSLWSSAPTAGMSYNPAASQDYGMLNSSALGMNTLGYGLGAPANSADAMGSAFLQNALPGLSGASQGFAGMSPYSSGFSQPMGGQGFGASPFSSYNAYPNSNYQPSGGLTQNPWLTTTQPNMLTNNPWVNSNMTGGGLAPANTGMSGLYQQQGLATNSQATGGYQPGMPQTMYGNTMTMPSAGTMSYNDQYNFSMQQPQAAATMGAPANAPGTVLSPYAMQQSQGATGTNSNASNVIPSTWLDAARRLGLPISGGSGTN